MNMIKYADDQRETSENVGGTGMMDKMQQIGKT